MGLNQTTEKKKIKRAYAAKSREFHPEEFQRIHDAYEEALAWAERNVESEVGQQMPEEPRQMEMGAAEQEKQRNLKHGIMQSRRETRKRLTWKILRKKMYSQKNLLRSMKNFLCILTKILRKVSGKKRQESHLYS